MLIGVNLFGYVSDACGRKIGFFATAVFSAFMGVGSAVAPTYAVRPRPPPRAPALLS